jgi:AraC family transcriptional activator of tynA and feaB
LGPCISSARSVALLNVRAVIESRLSDPHLNATSVAEAAGVSIRYANALLAEENTSIMRLVLAMRLARCRQALEDPFQDNRTVSEIAYGWGFSDMTHFGRCFKAMYDVSPRDYRKSANGLRRGAVA